MLPSQVLREAGVSALWHFTDIENLRGISVAGLMPRAAVQSHPGLNTWFGMRPGGTTNSMRADDERGLDRYIHLSLDPNTPMMWTRAGRLHPVLLKLPLQLADEGAAWTAGNALGSSAIAVPSSELDVLSRIAREIVAIRRGGGQFVGEAIKERVQSEILVPGPVAVERIETVYVQDSESLILGGMLSLMGEGSNLGRAPRPCRRLEFRGAMGLAKGLTVLPLGLHLHEGWNSQITIPAAIERHPTVIRLEQSGRQAAPIPTWPNRVAVTSGQAFEAVAVLRSRWWMSNTPGEIVGEFEGDTGRTEIDLSGLASTLLPSHSRGRWSKWLEFRMRYRNGRGAGDSPAAWPLYLLAVAPSDAKLIDLSSIRLSCNGEDCTRCRVHVRCDVLHCGPLGWGSGTTTAYPPVAYT